MDCPNCGVYNPEDRIVCWRCDQELPKPKESKKKSTDPAQAQRRIWLILIVALVVWILITWILPRLLGGGLLPGS
ncbi:MAG: hypothetical protein ACK2UC_05000 [Anaerolineae bacterium]|jgi:uncharacterized membrane protein YvbJ